MSVPALPRAAEVAGDLLFRLTRSISAVECEETRCCGVTMGQGLALLALKGEGQITMREVAAAIGVSAGTATRVVDNLVRDGLAERAEDPADRRKVCIRPTRGGEKKITQLEECYGRFWEDVFGRIPKKKLSEALQVLEVVVEAVEEARLACCENTGARSARLKEGAGA